MLPQQGFHVYRERSGPKSLAGDDAFIAERELLSIAEGRTSSFIYNIPAFTGQCMYQYMILKYIPVNVLFLLHIYYSNLKGGFHLHFAKITVLTYFKFKVGTLVLREQELSNLAKGCMMVKLLKKNAIKYKPEVDRYIQSLVVQINCSSKYAFTDMLLITFLSSIIFLNLYLIQVYKKANQSNQIIFSQS